MASRPSIAADRGADDAADDQTFVVRNAARVILAFIFVVALLIAWLIDGGA